MPDTDTVWSLVAAIGIVLAIVLASDHLSRRPPRTRRRHRHDSAFDRDAGYDNGQDGPQGSSDIGSGGDGGGGGGD